jgi:TonB-linked SusC/RagA family outer membrane protein
MFSSITAQNEKTDTLSFQPEETKSAGLEKGPNVLLYDQEPATLLQSVSTISGDRLLHRPAFQMEQSLDGTLPGLHVDLVSGYPTQRLSLQMRRRNLMIVVDGVPRADANLSPNQIESVSLIKDGLGLAAWGMSSGDGVLYIKTKRGASNQIKIDFTAQYAQAQQIYRPEMLDAYTYADLLNKALINDGSDPLYSERDLELYRTGANPYTHPNNDWYSLLLRDKSPIQQYNLNLSGGNESARYFIDLNMFDQDGFLKQDKTLNAYNTRESFKKWSIRTNVDVNLTNNTLLSVNLYGQMYRENTPGTLMSTVYEQMLTTPANAYPVFNPPADLDGKGVLIQTYGGNINYPYNLYAATMATGYILYPQTDLNFDISLEQRFAGVLNGLYVKGLYSYNSTYRESRTNNKGPDVWQYTYDPEKEPNDPSNYTKIIAAEPPSRSSGYNRQNRLQYIELHAGYDFNAGLNNSKTRLTYWNNQFILIGDALPMYKQGFNLHSGYDYDKKYMAEISLGANSLNYLKKGYQWGFFPAAGLGWNIAREDFFKVPAINTLKLRTTLGLNGNDGTGSFYRSGTGSLGSYYYTYIPTYESGGSVYLGQSSTAYSTLVEGGLPYVSQWEKSLRFALGVDVEAFDRSLQLGVEYFNNHHFDILSIDVSKSYSGLLGITPAAENFAAYRQQGIEFDLTYQNQFGDFSFTVNPLVTIYKATMLKNGEPEFPEPYMQYVGRNYYQTHGYIAEGIFQSPEEIEEYMAAGYYLDGYTPQPGDIRYKDLNEDYKIDGLDIDEIFTNAPYIEYGLYLDANWKGFGLNMQWTGTGNTQAIVSRMPFTRNNNAYGNAFKENLDYWTPDNPNATYPRLTAGDNSYNTRTSTFWVKNTDYLRLKNIELYYSLPQSWLKSIRIAGIKVFVNAYNAVTITPLEYRDPEMVSYSIPNFKAYNVGLNVQF